MALTPPPLTRGDVLNLRCARRISQSRIGDSSMTTSMLTDRRLVSDREFVGWLRPQQIRHFEVEGYVILPDVLPPALIGQIKSELRDLPMRGSFYSPDPVFGAKPPNWHSRSCAALIGHPPTLDFLQALMGDEIVFTHGHYMT